MKKKAISAAAVGALVTALVVGVEAPAFAAVCKASVSYGVSGTTAAATEYNSSTAADKCAQVQVRFVADQGGGVSVQFLGPISTTTSYKSGYTIGTAWYGKAKPAVTWSTVRWDFSGQLRSFTG